MKLYLFTVEGDRIVTHLVRADGGEIQALALFAQHMRDTGTPHPTRHELRVEELHAYDGMVRQV